MPQRANADDDKQGREQAECRGGLDEAGVEAAFAVRRMLGDIGRGAAIFATERQALQQSEQNEHDRRGDAHRRVARKQADAEGRQAHDRHRDEEGVLAADQVADPPEQDRAERADRETGREGGEREDEAGRLVDAREELRGDDRREQAVQVEIIPFEDGAERRRGDDELLALLLYAGGGRIARGRNRRHIHPFCRRNAGPMVPGVGLEPTTYRLQGGCSTS